MFKNIGVVLAGFAMILSGYEFFALVTPLPTLSRITQGLRDDGHVLAVFLISGFCVCFLAMFGAWLYYHFNYQIRSNN